VFESTDKFKCDPDKEVSMKEPEELYEELLNANAEKDEMKDVGKDILQAAFNSELVEIQYRTEDPDLNVGEITVDESKFFIDGARVRNLGMTAGANLDIRASYYDTARSRSVAMSPKPDLSPGVPGNGEVITVNASLQLTLNHYGLEGDGMVMFTKGRT
jgi:hypothetical protein